MHNCFAALASTPLVPRYFKNWVGKWVDEWAAKNNKLPNIGHALNLGDLECLDNDEWWGWLKDPIIHSVMQLMAFRAKELGLRHYYFDPFQVELLLAGKNDVCPANLVLENVDLIFFPTNVPGLHWFLTIVDVRQRELTLYESLHEERADYIKKMGDLIAIWAKRQKYTPLVPTSGAATALTVCAPKTKLAIRKDSSSCGLHTLANADCVGSGRNPNCFGNEPKEYENDMIKFRKRLQKLLMKFVVSDSIPGSPGRLRIV